MIKTRFAPSPTGHLHIGGARTAIISWLISKKLNGMFSLRIEDTDLERSKAIYTDSIMDSLKWLGIGFDEGPVYQTHRLDRYKEVAEQLVKNGYAYYCYSTNEELQKQREDFKSKTGHDGWKYDRKWRENKKKLDTNKSSVIRLKVPLDGSVSWKDLIKGNILISNSQLDDFIIMRSDGMPTYNFCVVVDDMDMKMTHIIRGDDHINNTPKQIHIYKALDYTIPIFGHIPLILNADGKKQSKRNEDTNISFYRNKGVLPEALINYLLLISCNNVEKEIFTKSEFVDLFELDKLGNTPIKFDEDKLLWINQQHIKLMPSEDFIKEIKRQIYSYEINAELDISKFNFSILENAIKDRSKFTNDFYLLIAPILNFNNKGLEDPLIISVLNKLLNIDIWSSELIQEELKIFATEQQMKLGEIIKPFRENVFLESKLPLADIFMFFGKDFFSNCILRNTKKLHSK
jgi:glutamyl-tRNA synthetase